MSRARPITQGKPRPENTAVLLREAYLILNGLALTRLSERGHGAVRAAHGTVFQYLDDTGTTVSTLAERAQITKQAMAELVQHLERHGYVERTPDPADRRAKLVRPTERGREVIAIAQGIVPEFEAQLGDLLGERRTQQLRADLTRIAEHFAGGPN
jgi:DNA-binding MarR family transcriptional regulator